MKINKYNISKEGGSDARQVQGGTFISNISNKDAEVTDEAQRLKETHLIFGQPFNGSQDVSGDISNAQNINASGGDLTIKQEVDDEGVNGGNIIVDGNINAGGNVSGSKFIGDVEADWISASEGDIALINANNINVGGSVTIEDKLKIQELEVYTDEDGALFSGASQYTFDGTINAEEGQFQELETEDLSATNAEITDTLKTNKFEGVLAEIKKLISEDIEVDNLTVKKAAHFFKLIIDEIKSVGGQIIISPTNASFDKVVASGSDYKCYFRAEDGGKKIDNQFEIEDQVVCQTFNAAEGTSYNTSNKFYWCLVSGVGSEVIDGIDYHYIVLSGSDKDSDSNGVPEEGDKVALLGNRSDTSRQNAIVISAYSAAFLDSGLEAPFIAQYKGINNYNLSNHRNSIISNGMNMFKGDFVLTSGESVGGEIAQIKEDANNISLLVQQPNEINMFEGSDSTNFSCWGVSGNITLSNSGTMYTIYNSQYSTLKSGKYILAQMGVNGYLIQKSKYVVTNKSLKLTLSVLFGNGINAANVGIYDNSGVSLASTQSLKVGTNTYSFTLSKVPNDTIVLKIYAPSGAVFAFKEEKALMESVPKRISGIEVDVDSITSRVATAEGNITQVTQKADGLTTRVTSAEGNISQIQQTTNSITSRVTSVEGNVSQLSQKANELSSKITSAEGNISQIVQNTNQITNRISNVEGNVSQLSQKANAIESTVSKIQVGGKNLINDSEFTTYGYSNSKWSWTNADCNASFGYLGQNGLYAANSPSNNGAEGYLNIGYQSLKNKLKPDTYYTFSFYAKGTEGSSVENDGTKYNFKARVTTYVYPNVGSELADNAHTFALTSEWKRYSYTFRTTSNLNVEANHGCLFRLVKTVENGTTYYSDAYVCMPKIEEGTMATDWESNADDMKSYITQKADSIESKIVTEDTINSKISQSKSNIKAEVFNDLNESTGIDIASGTITLNANKTVFNGNINMRNSDEGLVVFDNKGNPSVIIQNKQIPTLANLNNSTHDYITTAEFTKTATNTFASASQKVGSARVGDTIVVEGGGFYFCYKNSSNVINAIPLSSTSYVEYYYTLKNTTTNKTTTSSTKKLTSTTSALEGGFLESFTHTVTEEGNFEVVLNLKHINPTTTYSTYHIVWGYYLDKNVSQYTQLGTNGLVSVQDQYKYLYFGNEGFEARMSYYNGFRVTKNYCQQVIADYNDKTLWGSLASMVRVAVNPQTTSMAVSTGGTSQGTKNVVRADADYYGVDNFIFKSLSSEVWVKLPTALIQYEGANYYLGVGRVVRVKNLTSQKCYVYISDSGYKIYDKTGTSGSYYINIGNGSAEFVWDGSEWVRMY